MARFNDFNFADDGGGPDTDPTPGEFLIDDDEEDDGDLQSTDPTDTLPSDATNYTEPGEGDSFAGEDPSVWSGNGNANEPEAQVDQASTPVEIGEQSSTTPYDPSYGRRDDPDSVENVSDEAVGDDESDDANVEEIIAKPYVDEDELEPDDRYTETEHLIQTVDEYLLQLESDIDELMESDIFGDDEFFDIDDVIDYDDEYNIPGLGEILGSLDINDFIGDLTNESKIIEFQDIDQTIPDLDEEYGFM